MNLFFRGLELYVLFYVEKMLILFICKILYVILLKNKFIEKSLLIVKVCGM